MRYGVFGYGQNNIRCDVGGGVHSEANHAQIIIFSWVVLIYY